MEKLKAGDLLNNISLWERFEFYKKSIPPINQLLEQYEIEYHDKGGYLYINCPYHDDSTPSLYICDIEDDDLFGIFKCWGCGKTGNIFELLHYMGYDIKYIKNVKNDKNFDYFDVILKENHYNNEMPKIMLPGEFKEINKGDKFYKYLKRRNITDSVIRKFDIGCCDDGYYNNRVIIPMFYKGELFSFCARSIFTNKYLMKYNIPKILYPKFSNITHHLYPDIYDIKDDAFCYVVEGVFDALKMYSDGFRNVFTTFSNKLSKRQEFLLSRFKKIFLIPDGDEGGEEFISCFSKSSIAYKTFFAKLEKDKDPCDSESLSMLNYHSMKSKIKPLYLTLE